LTRFVSLGAGVGLTTLVGLILLVPFVGFTAMGSFGVDSRCFEETFIAYGVAGGIGAVQIFFDADEASVFAGLFLLFDSGTGL
jgi:hypothetical protein